MSRYRPFRTEWVVVKGTSHVERDSALIVEYRRSQVDSHNNQSSLVHTTHHVRVVVDDGHPKGGHPNRNATACSKLTSHGFETTRHSFSSSQHTATSAITAGSRSREDDRPSRHRHPGRRCRFTDPSKQHSGLELLIVEAGQALGERVGAVAGRTHR